MQSNVHTVLAHWDIPPVTSIAAVHEDRPVFKVTTVGPTFILKDISDAPDLTRLEFTRDVLITLLSKFVLVSCVERCRFRCIMISFQNRNEFS